MGFLGYTNVHFYFRVNKASQVAHIGISRGSRWIVVDAYYKGHGRRGGLKSGRGTL